MMKSNKGITLVALVITIIVLLILAGVSISLVVGDNGIMTRAKDAGTKTNEADALESFKLAVASITSEYYSNMYTASAPTGTVAAYVASKIKDELETLDYSFTGTMASATKDGNEITITKTGAKTGVTILYDVTSSGNVSNIKLKTTP